MKPRKPTPSPRSAMAPAWSVSSAAMPGSGRSAGLVFLVLAWLCSAAALRTTAAWLSFAAAFFVMAGFALFAPGVSAAAGRLAASAAPHHPPHGGRKCPPDYPSQRRHRGRAGLCRRHDDRRLGHDLLLPPERGKLDHPRHRGRSLRRPGLERSHRPPRLHPARDPPRPRRRSRRGGARYLPPVFYPSPLRGLHGLGGSWAL